SAFSEFSALGALRRPVDPLRGSASQLAAGTSTDITALCWSAAEARRGTGGMICWTILQLPKMARSFRCVLGRACPLCPGISDVNLFSYRKRVIDLNAEVSDSAFDFGVPEQELHGS